MHPSWQSDVGRIESVLVKHARDAFVDDRTIDRQWAGLHYTQRPDLPTAVKEYDHFVSLLGRCNIEIHHLPPDARVGLDSLYPRDASIVCDRGAILCSMGKTARRPEPAVQEEVYARLGIPIAGRIEGNGRLEGGDVTWLDERTVAVARGYRTNDEGIRQFRALLGDSVDDVLVVPLPHHRGPDDVFHLMSIISPIDRDLAIVYSPLMPVTFREALLARGFELVEVPDNEFDSLGCNVLAVAPRTCVMVAGNPTTRARLMAAGATVYDFEGTEICAKGCGGPTCLTRPLARAPIE